MELYNPAILHIPCVDDDDYQCTEIFSDGQMSFDGNFYVYTMPAGKKVFAGSLAQDHMLLHTFSTGFLFTVEGPDNIPEEIFHRTGPSWFGGYNVASIYSRMKECPECVYVFTLKRDVTLIVLSNAYNLAKIAFEISDGNFHLEEDDETDEANDEDTDDGTDEDETFAERAARELSRQRQVPLLYRMFPGLEELYSRLAPFKKGSNWLTPILVEEQMRGLVINRVSNGPLDFNFSVGLMMYLRDNNLNYSGYMSPSFSNTFHEEVMFLNPYEVLTRDFTDPRDASNAAVRVTQGPVLQRYSDQLSQKKERGQGGTVWAHTVWALLYAEKIISRYRKVVNLDGIDSRFIAFATLVHEVPNEELASELGVPLDDERRRILRMTADRYPEFEKIVNRVASDPGSYVIFDREKLSMGIYDIDHPPCEDFRDSEDARYCEKKLTEELTIKMGPKLAVLFNNYSEGMSKLAVITLLVVSMAHVLGLTPYGRGRVSRHGGSLLLRNLVASSHYFPINNQYQSDVGSPDRSNLMRRVGIAIGDMCIRSLF